MLPLKEINLGIVSPDVENLNGESFLFEWNSIIEHCKKANMSLDRFLTIRICSYIQSKKYKVPIFILFTSKAEYFKLTICSKSKADFFPCLHSTSGIPGYLDYGAEYVESRAMGFLYYDGKALYRTYQPLEWPIKGNYFASDFGNLFCLNVFAVDKEFYDELVNEPSLNPEQSFMSEREIETIVMPQNSLIIRHVILKVTM